MKTEHLAIGLGLAGLGLGVYSTIKGMTIAESLGSISGGGFTFPQIPDLSQLQLPQIISIPQISERITEYMNIPQQIAQDFSEKIKEGIPSLDLGIPTPKGISSTITEYGLSIPRGVAGIGGGITRGILGMPEWYIEEVYKAGQSMGETVFTAGQTHGRDLTNWWNNLWSKARIESYRGLGTQAIGGGGGVSDVGLGVLDIVTGVPLSSVSTVVKTVPKVVSKVDVGSVGRKVSSVIKTPAKMFQEEFERQVKPVFKVPEGLEMSMRNVTTPLVETYKTIGEQIIGWFGGWF